MSMPATALSRSIPIPSTRTLTHLVIGGFAGLGFWEVWSAVPTAWLAGFALEPPELVKALIYTWTRIETPTTIAKLIHYITGFLFYPLGYFLITRGIKRFGMPADGWIWGVATYFIALGFFAPLAGQRFLLLDVPVLSFMSLVGHAIYGWLAADVFERLER